MQTLAEQFEHLNQLDQRLHASVSALQAPKAWLDYLQHPLLASPGEWLRQLPEPQTRFDYALRLGLLLGHQVEQHGHLDPALMKALAPMWLTFAASGLRDWAVWQVSRHPLRLILEQLVQIGRCYCPSEHAAARQFTQHLHGRLQTLAKQTLENNDLEASIPVLKSVLDLLQQLRDQQLEADKRLLEQRSQQARSTHAHSAVSRAIRHAVLGQPVSAVIIDFLDQHWRKYLYTVYLRFGMNDARWQQGLQDIELMVHLSSFASAEELKAKQKSVLAPLLKRLTEALNQIHLPPGIALGFTQEFTDILKGRARNHPAAGLPLGEWPEDEDLADQDRRSAPAYSDDGPTLGQTIIINLPNKPERARVIEVDHSHDEILLADFGGQLVLATDHGQWHRHREHGELTPCPEHHPFDFLQMELSPVIDALIQHNENLLAQQKNKRRQQREAEIAASIEQRKQADATARAARIATQQAEHKRQEQLQKAKQIVSQLRSGALVQLPDSRGVSRPCYLALIDAEKSLHVFVDRQGKKLAELDLDALSKLLLEEKLKIMESGSALDSALKGLIAERRQFLQEEDGE